MQQLDLNTASKSYLTATQLVPDPANANAKITLSFVCGLNGKALPLGTPGIPVYRDTVSGTVYAQVAEFIPSAPDSASVETAKYLRSLNPVFYTNADGSVKGWFVEAPNFDSTSQGAAQ